MPDDAREPVRIAAADLPLGDLLRIAHGARVELTPDAVDRIRASRAVVDALVDGPTLIYGLNTGLGHLRDVQVPRETLRRYQELIVIGHEGAIGDPLPTDVVRAAIAVRLNGIARGGSGASLPVAEGLAALLNRRVHPIVATTGSVGASDLMHMAAIAQVLIGRGRAEVGGEVLPGAAALARVGLEPIVLEPKDGLTLISANGVSIGHAALVAEQARRVARVADLALAASLEVVSGNPSVLDAAVLAAKPVPGQAAAGADIRAFLAGSGLFTPGVPASVQDPLSFRVGPQVHGAFREFIDVLERQVTIELNAMDDNPLVDVASGRMLSNGNFHPMALAIALDAIRPAIAHVGQLSDRRMNHLLGAALGAVLQRRRRGDRRAGRRPAAVHGCRAQRRAPARRRPGDPRHRPARPRRRGPRHERAAHGAAKRGGPRDARGHPRHRAPDLVVRSCTSTRPDARSRHRSPPPSASSHEPGNRSGRPHRRRCCTPPSAASSAASCSTPRWRRSPPRRDPRGPAVGARLPSPSDLLLRSAGMSERRRYYLTTAIAYANNAPGLHTVYEVIGADVIARWHRMLGDDTRFLTGTDEHSVNIAQAAAAEGRTPREFVDEKVALFRAAEDALLISPDRFIRTTDPDHYLSAQEMVRRAYANGDIYLGTYEGWYCPNEGFKATSDLLETARGMQCPNHPDVTLQWLTERNWFFRLSAYQERLLALLRGATRTSSSPTTGATRCSASSAAASRTSRSAAPRATWGIPFPIAENGETAQREDGSWDPEAGTIYVWYDALINYITGAGFPGDLDAFASLVARRPPRHRQGHRPVPHDLLAGDAVVGRHRGRRATSGSTAS